MLSLVLAVPRSAATDTWGNRVGKPPRGCWTSDPHAAVPVVSAPRGDKIRVRPVFWHLCTGDGSPERLGDFPRATARESRGRPRAESPVLGFRSRRLSCPFYSTLQRPGRGRSKARGWAPSSRNYH